MLNELIEPAQRRASSIRAHPRRPARSAERFKNFNPRTSTPTRSVDRGEIGGADVQFSNEPQAEPILNHFRGEQANAVDSTDPGRRERHACGRHRRPRRRTSSLPLGFTLPEDVGDADRFDYTQTVVRYLPGNEAKAPVRSRATSTHRPIVEQTNFIAGADVVVVSRSRTSQGSRSSPGPTVADSRARLDRRRPTAPIPSV